MSTINLTPTGGDDTSQIVNALKSGNTLNFSKDTFKCGAIKLVSNVIWNATGATFQGISLSGTIDNVKIDGGTYNGSAKRLIELVSTNSTYSNMTLNATGGHGFGLQFGSTGNTCTKIVSNGSALADHGNNNTWTDCTYNGPSGSVDGFIVKCQNSTFTRCIVKNATPAGFGLYAKLDTANQGIEIYGNKFFDCEGSNNGHAGFSLNPTNFGGKVHDNFIQGIFTGNKIGQAGSTGPGSSGGLDCIQSANIYNNTFDIIVHDNPGGGLHIGDNTNNNTGSCVAYNNGNWGDISISSSATKAAVDAYEPADQKKPSISGNTINEKPFSCTSPPGSPPFCVTKYCGIVIVTPTCPEFTKS